MEGSRVSKSISIDHSEIGDAQSITPQMEKAFKRKGLDLHRHEVVKMDDDFKTGKRHLTIKHTQYHTMSAISQENWDRTFGKN